MCRMQCSGFVYAVATADQFIKTGMYKNVLVIGSEYHSGGLDMTTRGRNISVIFGDGAGAVVMTRAENKEVGVLNSQLHSEGKYAKELSLLSKPCCNATSPLYRILYSVPTECQARLIKVSFFREQLWAIIANKKANMVTFVNVFKRLDLGLRITKT